MKLFAHTQVLLGTLVLSQAAVAFAQCGNWQAGPLSKIAGVSGNDGFVAATVMWDPDGSGVQLPQIVIGGSFSSAGGVACNCIARWDGTTWKSIGAGPFDQSGSVIAALAVLPSTFPNFPGQLIAGGYFTTMDGVTCYSIARYDGSAWHALGSGIQQNGNFAVPDYVFSLLAVPAGSGPLSNKLIVGGQFDKAGGVPANSIAVWDGTNWSAMGTGLGGEVYSLTLWDPDGAGPQGPQVTAGGFFTFAGATAVNGVARWDGAAWQPFGPGLSNPPTGFPVVYAVATIPAGNGPFAGQLVAGGGFTNAGSTVVNALARWDGAAWQPFGSGTDGYVNCFTTWDPDGAGPLPAQLVVGGDFDNINGRPVGHGVAVWDGSNWQSAGGNFDAPVSCLGSFTPNSLSAPHLIACGQIPHAGSAVINGLAHYDTAAWLPFGGLDGVYGVTAMAQVGPRMVATGNFTANTYDGSTTTYIAGWDGLSPTTLGSGLNAVAEALKSYNTGSGISTTYHLVAGGDFTTAGGINAKHIALWNEPANQIGASWTALGPGLNLTVDALERFNNLTIAGGQFTATGDNATTLNHIAAWNGTSWSQLGTGLDSNCLALKVYNGALYAGGIFTHANGSVLTGGLARWDGSTWTAVGGNFVGHIFALEVYNGELIIGGNFPGLSGATNIAKYNSTTNTYSTLGGAGTAGESNYVTSLAAANGKLYMGGSFSQVGGVTMFNIACWNGSSWSEVQSGADGTVEALLPFHGEVEVGGGFGGVHYSGVDSPAWGRYLDTGVPWLVRQPFSAEIACGATATFSVQPATGYGPLTYTWRRNGTPLVNGQTGGGSIVWGVNTATLSILNSGSTDAGSYDCIVASTCGSVTSIAASLTVDAGSPPTIQTQPASAGACGSGSATFSVTPSGSGSFTYQWQIQLANQSFTNLTAGSTALPCGGTASASAPQSSTTGISITGCSGDFLVRVLVSNGCATAISNVATLRVCNIGGDLDCSGGVDLSDISILLSNYGVGTTAAQGDLNGDHQVNLSDLAMLLADYGSSCP